MDKLLEQKLEEYWKDKAPHGLPEYKEAKAKLDEMMKRLSNLLPNNEKEIFINFWDLMLTPEMVASEHAFKQGFKSGLKLHLEMEKWIKL